MLRAYKIKINLGLGLGLLFVLLGSVLAEDKSVNSNISLTGDILLIVGAALFVYGCSMYAKAKGHSWLWGFLGLTSLLGLIILYFFKDLNKTSNDKVTGKERL